MARRRPFNQPTDVATDSVDRALAEPADEGDYEAPDVDELLQREHDEPAEIVVPVRLTEAGPFRVEQLPTRLEISRSTTIAMGAAARRVLPENPRRARVTLWAAGADVVIAETPGECDMFTGAVLSAGLAVPYHFGFLTGLYARTADGADAAAVLNIVTEAWSL
jgi:hypothetical protein